jgi:two-component system sensor histidine kinase CiaH
MFNQARIKLTLVYLAIMLSITGSLSVAFYSSSMSVFRSEFRLIERRLEDQENRPQMGPGGNLPADVKLQILSNNLVSARQQIFWQLIRMNAVVAIIFLIAGYYFSGKTLEPIERALKKQKKFVADASHELKTPVAALKTSLEVNLLDKKISKKSREILEENLADVSSLEKLVNELLDVARMDVTKMELAAVPLKKVVERALRHTQALADFKNIKLNVIWQKGLKKEKVLAEENGLLEVLMILIDNAIKYTPRNKNIYLEIKSVPKSRLSRKQVVEIVVRDEGEGIPKPDLEHIFDRFYQVNQARTRDHKGGNGYGLGLSLAKEIVEQFKGKLEVKSQVGKGSKFILNLFSI